MLGMLLVLVQFILFVCIIILLVFMQKNTNTRKAYADSDYASAYQDDAPEYHEYDYNYEDNDGGEYEDYYDDEASPEAMSAARRIKTQQQGYVEESERYYAAMENVQRYAEQDEATRRFTASAYGEEPQYRPATEQALPYGAAQTQSAAYAEQPPTQTYVQPVAKPVYAEQQPAAAPAYSAEPAVEEHPPVAPAAPAPKSKPAPPEPKGVLFDDDDDDSPFSVKF